jgi:Tol biopolymer transport system component
VTTPKRTPEYVRQRILAWAHWCVFHKAQFRYEEIRPFPLTSRLPITNDCSATFTLLYWLAGAPDPNGPKYHYDGYGNTGSLAANGQQVMLKNLIPSDAVIYYEGDETVHVAVVIDPNDGDPITMSHGWSGEPALIKVSEDGRPHRFYRFATNYRF